MSISDEEAYQRGLGTLGLWKPGTRTVYWPALNSDPGPYDPPDLRRDPAFAWRVLEACRSTILSADGPPFHPEVWLAEDDLWHVRFDGWRPDFRNPKLADALYAAVCELGRQE